MDDFLVPLLSGGTESVARCFAIYGPWSGPEVERTWNKSPLVEYEGRGPFAELALLGVLEREGWDGVWVYRANKFTKVWHPVNGPMPQPIPEEMLDLYRRIAERCKILCDNYSVGLTQEPSERRAS